MKIVRPITITDAMVSTTVTETTPAYNSGHTYAKGDVARVTDTDYGHLFESLQESNTGHDPLADDQAAPVWWLDLGSDNQHRPFDQRVGLQSTDDFNQVWTITPGEQANTLVLLNVKAGAYTVQVTDPVEGLVYSTGGSLIDPSGITDWFSYYFDPLEYTDNLVVPVPIYPNATIQVALISTNGDSTALGELVLGLSKEIGDTEYGASVGIQDYSIKTPDEYGTFGIQERPYSDTGDFEVWIEKTYVDALKRLLRSYRATPLVYIGSDDYNSTVVYGFFKDFSVAINYPTVSVCNLEVESLT